MLFNSFRFLYFFPAVTAAYFLLPQRFRWMLLLAASCLFYMAFVPKYILILGATIVIDYVAGILIEQSEGQRRRIYLIVSLISNIGFLAFFKYFNFVSDNLQGLATFLHWNYSFPTLNIILPIGLSFHTFQAMSYTIEVYRGNQPAERHFGIYALYVMFYPQLVAGPIERPQNLLHQFRTEYYWDWDRVAAGVKRMAWGMFKKVVVADNLAVVVGRLYDHPTEHHGLAFVVATVFFAYQIYCDFSGYCDIALGAAQVMGFTLMENFNRPYFSKSISEFWRRWHISLSAWFRDYVYISLGGNRVSLPRVYVNLLIVFLISGLWHGAKWTFIVWGGIHGIYLIFATMTREPRAAVAKATGLQARPRLLTIYQVLVTFFLVCVGWVFFRANTLQDAGYILGHLFSGMAEAWSGLAGALHGAARGRLGMETLGTGYELILCLLLVATLEGIHLLQRHGPVTERLQRMPTWARWSCYEALLLAIYILGRYDSPQFIYFQF